MNRDSFYPAIACFPLLLMLAGCAPMHETRQALSQQTPAAQVDTALPTALKNGWPDSQWWLEYHDNQLTSLINNALQNAPDMQVAEQRIQLAEAQAKAVATQDGPQIDFSADMERQKMSAEGLMGPFALNDPAAGTTGPWYTNGTFGLTAGWHLDIWGKNRAEVTARLGTVKARAAEREQTRQLLAGSVARLYWEWQTQAALNTLVTYAERNGRRLVCVSLRTNGRQIYTDTASLLDYGFNNFQNYSIFNRKTWADAKMLYPSLYFGQPETVANLRPTCTVTLPAGMDLSSVETTCNPGDGTLCRSYTYNQYPVGCESIPDTAIQALLHSEPTNICKKSGSAAASDLGNSAKETASGIFQKVLAFVAPVGTIIISVFTAVPWYYSVLGGMLLLIIIMEIVLAVKKKKRRKKKKTTKKKTVK